jgi:DNA helicase-2/ATP-dependent DNA helicase PcrA
MISKIDNINSFYILMDKFFREKQGTIDTFINLYSINENDKKEERIDRKISLVSIHLSKGLEFKHVFVIGLNQGFLPSYNNADSEEERRLAYVAFTRAKEKLYLTSANFRTLYGKRQEIALSQYLYEANILTRKFEPDRDIKNIKKKDESREFKVGDRVEHIKFGYGMIKDISRDGKQTFLTILFVEDDALKKMLSKAVVKR